MFWLHHDHFATVPIDMIVVIVADQINEEQIFEGGASFFRHGILQQLRLSISQSITIHMYFHRLLPSYANQPLQNPNPHLQYYN